MDALLQALTFVLYAIGAYIAFVAIVVLAFFLAGVAYVFWPRGR